MTDLFTLLPDRDEAHRQVAAAILAADPTGVRWGKVFRHSYDMIYNGQETGRYRWDQLMKTEKTHFGTIFEINAQREFEFEGRDEDKTDYRIVGHPVDAKWSQADGGWMLPPEVFGELALVATADDARSVWSLGLIRVNPEYRRESVNRDRKSQLNRTGRMAVEWLWREAPMPQNVLLRLPENVVEHIFASNSGSVRTHRLFRAAEGQLVHRNAVATVSRQLDSQKRVRYNGGSRSALASEGFIILSGKYHSALAYALDLPVPGPAEYISVRLVRANGGRGVQIDGELWRRATSGEPPTMAPRIPERGITITQLGTGHV